MLWEETISFNDVIHALKKRCKLIISCILFGAFLSATVTLYIVKPLYMVRSKVFIGSRDQNDEVYEFIKEDQEDSESQEGNENYGLMYQKLLETYVEALTSKDIIEDAMNNYGIEVALDDVLFGLTVKGKEETQILEITYTGNDRVEARNIVRAVTNELLKISKSIVPNVDAKIIQVASLPQGSIFPKKKINIAVGMFLGGFIGSAVALFLGLNNLTYRKEEQIENILGVQVLGIIPDENEEEEYDYY